jgi:thiol-disulfide isomerase/thioredoxin
MDGHFSFSGDLSQPEEFLLVYEDSGPKSSFDAYSIFVIPGNRLQVFLRPDSMESSTVSGPRLSVLYDQANKEIYDLFWSPIEDLHVSYDMAVENQDQELQEQLSDTINSYITGIREWKMNYIKTNPKSSISAFFLYTICQELSVEEAQSLYEGLNRRIHDSKYGLAVGNYLSVLPGNPYTDFEFMNDRGKRLAFSDLARNKVTLIDFWASWCGPCRQQNKLLIQLYEKHWQEGFEIVGVSTDRDTLSFQQTIAEDSMKWENFMDRIDGESVKKLYWATSVPSNVLVDKSGMIRFRNVETQTLAITIERLLEE